MFDFLAPEWHDMRLSRRVEDKANKHDERPTLSLSTKNQKGLLVCGCSHNRQE